MRETLQEALYAAYPALFRQRTLPVTESGMGWGIDCGDGWYRILDGLCEVLMGHACAAVHEPLEAVRVKRKFGRLCFYIDGDCPWCQGAIRFAEALSQLVCEETGRSGVLMTRLNRQLRVLAYDVGLAKGYRLVRPETAPAPLADELPAGRTTIVEGLPVDLPTGWTTIVQSLVVDLPSGDDGRAGILACARALAARVEA